MKRLERVVIVAVIILLSATTLSSCMGDDDGIVTLTQEQRTKWVNNAVGEYFGNVYVEQKTSSENDYDSINFEIKQDSTFTCTDFPVSILKSYVTDEPYATILSKSAAQTMTAMIHPFYGAYDQDYSYYLFPDGSSLHYQTEYGDQTYDVEIYYATSISTTDSQGNSSTVFPMALKNVLSDILTANILVDYVTINSVRFDVGKVIYLTGYPKTRYYKEETN